jgi:hypothetical protein
MRPSHFACNGDPNGYQKGTLWLHAALPRGSRDHEDLSLIIHSSRFDRLVVRFIYRDGAVEQQHVRSVISGPIGELAANSRSARPIATFLSWPSP